MIGTVLVLGGGGFSVLDEASALDDYLLQLTGKDEPKVCFVPTASGDADPYIERFLNAFQDRAQTSVLSLFCHDPWGYADPTMLLTQDIVYVGGGSTANLLAVWRLHGLPDILQTAAANGTILAGISAGMNCWFDASSTDSYGSVDDASNQQFMPALMPARIVPFAAAVCRMSGSPGSRQTASRFAVDPPPTYTMSWVSRIA